jgi:hypothetical protein
MIGTIRRHTKWLWAIIIGAMSFSLIYYFLPGQKMSFSLFSSSASSGPNLGSVNGEPITSQQLESAEREALLAANLRTGTWLNDSEEHKKQIEHLAEQLLLIESLAKQYKVNPTTDAVARLAKQVLGVRADQSVSADRIQDLQSRLRAGGLTLDDFDRFIRTQVSQEYLTSLFGLSGRLITAKEAEYFCRRENTPIGTEMVTFPSANYYGATAPSEAELQDFFSKHQAEYRQPDRIQINYVVFNPSNYSAQADKALGTNIDDRADQIYHQQGADNFKDESGKVLSPEAGVVKIKTELRRIAGMQEAAKDAYAFLRELGQGHDDAHPYSVSDLFKVAKVRNLIVKTTDPFNEQDGSSELDLAPKYLHILFSLRESDPDDADHSLLYVSSPLPGENAIYVAGLQKRIPSELRTLAQMHDEVVRDYREDKALTLARDAGGKFADAVQAGLIQGKSFAAVCEAQNLKPRTLPPFALTSTNAPTTMESTDFKRLQETAYALPDGEASRFIPSSDGGFVVFVKEHLPADEALIQQEVPLYLAKMRADRQMAAFQEWMGRQIQLHLVAPSDDKNGAG